MAPKWLAILTAAVMVPAVAGSRAFDFAALQDLIETKHVRSIEELLPALPATLRGRYALVFASRSLQDARLEAPRAILYGADARFVVTFNGAADQRGFNTLETMEFNDDTQQFQFREITFPVAASDAPSAIFSDPNPRRCQLCHGSPAHPVWGTPPLWPGVYGERYGAHLSPEELSGIRRFLERQAADSRYRNLPATARFADPETFRPSARNRYSGTWAESPNADLSLLFGRLVSGSVAQALSNNPGFGSYQYLLLGVSDGRCGSLDEFYPAERWRSVRAAFTHYRDAVAQENTREAAADRSRLTPGNRRLSAVQNRDSAALIPIVFIAESELNMPARGWSLALDNGTSDAAQTPPALDSLRDALLAKVNANDARVGELNEYATSSDGDRYCSYLKNSSRAALAARPPGAPAIRVSAPVVAASDGGTQAGGLAPPAALGICASCHQSDIAPNIPFASAEQLKDQLLSRRAPHGSLIDEIRFRMSPEAGPMRMPLGANLSDEQRIELENYFVQLVAQPARQPDGD
jgi:mono/diheme cytochrome c family protein